MMKTTREPGKDTRAQVAAVKDPRSTKQSAFFAAGTKVPKASGLLAVRRPEGALVTRSPAHAVAFGAPAALSSDRMAGLLGYPETKRQAIASGAPVVVQGRAKGGAVAHESLASPGGVLAAAVAAKAAVPGGKVVLTTPQALQARRKRL